MSISPVDEALDRLADMGMSALMRDVVEPVCAAMIARAIPSLSSKAGAREFFAGYWSMARAIGLAFDEPDIAIRCASMFFAAAPEACSAWAKTEMVEGRPRLGLLDLKELVEAAGKARDKNSGAYSRELVDAMVGRESESAQLSMRAALATEPARAPKVFDALVRDLEGSFLWPKDQVLDDMLDRLEAEAAQRGGLGAEMWEAAHGQISEAGMERRNHGLSCAFAIKLAARAARSPGAMGVDAAQWTSWMDHMIDSSDLARQQAEEHLGGLSKGLSKLDAQMLSSWGMVLGSARERLATELAIGALERSAEPGGAQASMDLLGVFKDLFWGRGTQLGAKGQESFQTMASALCNRLCRDGAAACLPLEGAKMLYGGLANFNPAPPESWSAATVPETMAWLMEEAQSRVSGGQWRQLAALARMGAIGPERQAAWERTLSESSWALVEGEDSLREAVSAKDLARGMGPAHPMGRAIVRALDRSGVPDGDALGRLQDLLGSLSDLGASDHACALAGDAMSQALAVLERASLEGAMSDQSLPAEKGGPKKARPRL